MFARRGIDVHLWARTDDEAATLRAAGQNERFVPGAMFPPSLAVTSSMAEASDGATVVMVVVPSRSLRDNARIMRRDILEPAIVISAAKGLEPGSGKRMTQLLEEELPESFHPTLCALSGPNLAQEIIEGKPSSTVIASRSKEASEEAQALLTSPTFRVYTNNDVVGVELGGALKNILALGAGTVDGLKYGDNAKAAFLTRGLAEITRLAIAAGANPLTVAGLAGVGDLIATCSSRLSRNHHVGVEMARGRPIGEILSTMTNVAEGIDTTAAAVALAERLGVEMPITQAIYRVLFEGVPISTAVEGLMGRAPAPEWAGVNI